MPAVAARRATVRRAASISVRFDSGVLRGNPLGDPSVRTVPVYLPPGYDDAANAAAATRRSTC